MHEAEHGLINISECEWPAFLYPPGTSPDVEDDQLGLFRGYLLIRVSVPFFFSKSMLNYWIFAGISSNFHWSKVCLETRGKKGPFE